MSIEDDQPRKLNETTTAESRTEKPALGDSALDLARDQLSYARGQEDKAKTEGGDNNLSLEQQSNIDKASGNRVVYQEISSELGYESGIGLSASPDKRAFDEGMQIYSKDTSGRPVMAEGWISSEKGPPTNKSIREVITGIFGAELNVSHLYPRSVGGHLEGNVVAFSAEGNHAMSSFEKSLSEMGKTEPVFVQAYAHYGDTTSQCPESMELRLYQRSLSGEPKLVDGCRVDFDGRRTLMT